MAIGDLGASKDLIIYPSTQSRALGFSNDNQRADDIAATMIRLDAIWHELGSVYVSSSSAYTATTSFSNVSGVTVTATTDGGKVRVSARGILSNGVSGADHYANVRVLCDGAVVGEKFPAVGAYLLPYTTGSTAFAYIADITHTPSAGSHTWVLQVIADANTAIVVYQPTFIVEELG